MTAKILCVEDEKTRSKLVRGLHESFDVEAYAPQTFKEFREKVLLEKPDGAVIDIRLPQWGITEDRKQPIDGYMIGNGIDICRFLHDNMGIPIGLHSGFSDEYEEEIDKLPFKPFIIDKAVYTSLETFKKKFNPVVRATKDSNKSNPQLSITPQQYLHLSSAEQIHLYKTVYSMNKKWVDTLFKAKGDFLWIRIRGRAVESFGRKPNSNQRKVDGVPIEREYPDQDKLIGNTGERKTLPFFFWNVEKVSMLETQFRLAGPGLGAIPYGWRNSFGIAVAPLCAQAYLEHNSVKVLRWFKELDEVGQLEVAKTIWKKLLSQGKVSCVNEFAKNFKQMKLPRIVEIFKARVEKIEGSHTAWVELKRWSSSQTISVEPFDLKRLKESCVKYEDQLFEYTVYESGGGNVSMNIEPKAVFGRNPFDSLTERKGVNNER
jgi:CheY-like chemotaxis protein